LAEQATLNRLVEGSSPSRVTGKNGFQVFDTPLERVYERGDYFVMNDVNIAIIGGGPAGFFAAIAAAEARPGLRIVILERSDRPLAKVSISGGGRCNLTHACYDPAELVTYYPRGAKALRGPFTRFQPRDTVAWFTNHGVALKTEPDGRIFPQSNRSESVVGCLLDRAVQNGITLTTRFRANKIVSTPNGFSILSASGEPICADKVLLAVGGLPASYSLAAMLGHTIIPPVPSLFTFAVSDSRLEGLAGISVPDSLLNLEFEIQTNRRNARRYIARGPLLITHWGVSGPAVLRLSAWGARDLAEAGYAARLLVNWLPSHSLEGLRSTLKVIRAANLRQHLDRYLPFDVIPQRLWKRLLAAAGVESNQPWGLLSNRMLESLVRELTEGEYRISGKGQFKEEFVTCGGVMLDEVDFHTMESRLCPGLYFAGEVLDVDGLTGGFNFQAAWTTGWIAGRAMVNMG
jgi:predicted Rossmann fold flavoprotein